MLKASLKARGITQQRAAELLGLSPEWVGKILNGATTTDDVLEAIARLCGLRLCVAVVEESELPLPGSRSANRRS